jgi:hypothetical protein
MQTDVEAATRIEKDQLDQLELNLILFSRDGRVWLTQASDKTLELPKARIPVATRLGSAAVSAAREQLRIDIFCLWTVQRYGSWYLIAELIKPSEQPEYLVSLHPELLSSPVVPDETLNMVGAAFRTSFQTPTSDDPEPFKRIGWFDRLIELLRRPLELAGFELTGEVEQLNASERFSLLRLDAKPAPLWFKAVGEPNLSEFSLTAELERLIPDIGPKIVATFPKWHAWVSEDAGGIPLSEHRQIEHWLLATRRLADIQARTIPHLDVLFEAGCIDARSHFLTKQLDQFVEAMTFAMAQDLEVTCVRLDANQIQQIAERLEAACKATENIGLPYALIHRDLSGGNIQISPSGCKFIDWAHACIGHPFICSEYLQVHFAKVVRDDPQSGLLINQIGDAYASRWVDLLTPDQLCCARSTAPLLAEYVYVLPLDGRSCRDLTQTQGNRAIMRSMARRMWRRIAQPASSTCMA